MSERRQREFNTVKEILEVYMPSYQEPSRGSSIEGEINVGSRLATDLLQEFRANIQRRTGAARKKEEAEEQ